MPKDPPIYNLELQEGTHVAINHEDTSPGAVHSFQDEKGHWWTYEFDEQVIAITLALSFYLILVQRYRKSTWFKSGNF
jgi:hypothetical protein